MKNISGTREYPPPQKNYAQLLLVLMFHLVAVMTHLLHCGAARCPDDFKNASLITFCSKHQLQICMTNCVLTFIFRFSMSYLPDFVNGLLERIRWYWMALMRCSLMQLWWNQISTKFMLFGNLHTWASALNNVQFSLSWRHRTNCWLIECQKRWKVRDCVRWTQAYRCVHPSGKAF